MVKVISLSNDAYEKLKALKRGKSFSDVVIELITRKKRKNIMGFAGIWKDDADYWDNFKKEIRKSRNKARLREVNF